jgi:predicted dehydrogenase
VRKVKLGLIGAGRIGRTYGQALASSEVAELTAVADINVGASQALAHDLGAESFAHHVGLLENAQVEAVIVCTPPATHSQVVASALERGLHVMCEKPFALSTAEASMLMGLAGTHGVVLTMASKFRYVADVVAAKALVNSGAIGDVVLVENTFASRVPMHDRWNSDRTISGGGVLIDNGTHSVDIVRYLLGPIREVLAVEGRRLQGLEVEDTAQLFARCNGGVRASVDLSWTIDKERDSYLDIYGSEGTILIGWNRSRYLTNPVDGWQVLGRGYDKMQAMVDQVRNFCRAFTHGEPLLISTLDALASVEVIAAAYSSMHRDNWVSLETVKSPVLKVS